VAVIADVIAVVAVIADVIQKNKPIALLTITNVALNN
jgi:hypothetical protein